MNKWLFHQNGFTRTSLSATVTRVSNFVEEIVWVWCVLQRQSSSSRWIQSLNAQHNRLNILLKIIEGPVLSIKTLMHFV